MKDKKQLAIWEKALGGERYVVNDDDIQAEVCPVTEKVVKTQPMAYAVWHKNDNVREKSSSGGVFTAIAEYVIKDGGIVYGCSLDKHMEAVHVGVENVEDLEILRGSKYIQSKVGCTYQDIKRCLQKGRKVLFVGTPCQAAGLYSFLGRGYEELYIVDFICHGVPSQKLFHKFIADIEQKYNKRVIAYKFRNKDHGWNQSGTQLGSGSRIEFSDGTYIRKYPAFMDHYMNAFLDDVCLRPSCYVCKFKDTVKDYSDFTIGDFWGVNKVSPNMNDGKGTSLLLVHNAHANEVLEKIKDRIQYQQVDFAETIRRNKSLIQSARLNSNRGKFYEELDIKGYRYVEHKYMSAFTWGIHKVINILKMKFKIEKDFIS